jgi:hypothetical protein
LFALVFLVLVRNFLVFLDDAKSVKVSCIKLKSSMAVKSLECSMVFHTTYKEEQIMTIDG